MSNYRRKKVIITMGIRPDGNKLSPLYNKFKELDSDFETILVNTGQHTNLLQEMLDIFKVKADYNLKTMKQGQSLFDITSEILLKLGKVFEKEKPDLVFTLGDGASALITAIAAYYLKIPVAHVEAGLRTPNLFDPHPEEGNRRMTTHIASYHLAPTTSAKDNLLNEGVESNKIYVTGNTVIDALKWVIANYKNHKFEQEALNNIDFKKTKVILLTTHRRENWGEPMRNALTAIKKLAQANPNVVVIFPVHPNPIVKELAYNILQNTNNVILTEPLSYISFSLLINKCHFIISDSGGIQEEAPTFGKPLLVMRKTTERPEGIKAGVAKLVGTNPDLIYNEASSLLHDKSSYSNMSKIINPYGDGHACERIAAITKYILYSPKEFLANDY